MFQFSPKTSPTCGRTAFNSHRRNDETCKRAPTGLATLSRHTCSFAVIFYSLLSVCPSQTRPPKAKHPPPALPSRPPSQSGLSGGGSPSCLSATCLWRGCGAESRVLVSYTALVFCNGPTQGDPDSIPSHGRAVHLLSVCN